MLAVSVFISKILSSSRVNMRYFTKP